MEFGTLIGLALVFVFGIFGYVYYTIKSNEYKKFIVYYYTLQEAGFTISKEDLKEVTTSSSKSDSSVTYTTINPQLKKWSMSKDGINFNVELTYTTHEFIGDITYRNYWFEIRFIMPPDIQENLQLKLSKRGDFSKFIGADKGQYHELNRDLSITSPNIMLVKHLLINPKNREELYYALNYGLEIDLTSINKARIRREIDFLVGGCNKFLDLIEVFREFIRDLQGEKPYTIKEILSDFDQDKTSFNCVVCLQSVLVNDALIFNCCSSVGHKDHLTQWLDKKTVCPYCRKTEFELLAPIQ